jgi:hypothetical protein
MIEHLRDSVEDVAVGVVMTAQVFADFDKSWITVLLGSIYIGYKIYTQHLKAKTERAKEEKEQLEKEMIKQQLQGWNDTKTKVIQDIKQQRDVQIKRQK